jgi:TetR/AcrR family transcriptional regulator, mexJK operon transcriptional repressor
MPDELAQNQIASPKRDAIVVAATELFLEHGFGDVSMDTIAAKAEVSKRTVYSHFENKAHLFEGIMGDACAGRQFVEDTGVPVDPPEQVLSQLGRTFLGSVTCNESVALYRVVMAEGSKFPELGKTFYNYGPESLSRKLGDYLEDQTAKGVLHVENSRQAANQFLAILAWPIMMELTIGVRGPVNENEIGEIVDTSVSTFLRAFLV